MSRIVTKNDVSPEDLQNLKGTSGTLSLEGLDFAVKVVDARIRFGHLDLAVSPVSGGGQRWVESHRVIINDIGPADAEVQTEMQADEKPSFDSDFSEAPF